MDSKNKRMWLRRSERARLLIMNSAGEILLVKNRIGLRDWELPGGGICRNETARQAAVREVFEEVGLELSVDELVDLGNYVTKHKIAPMNLHVFGVLLKAPPKIRIASREITAVQWLAISKLPADGNNNFREAVDRWVEARIY